jgi:hypothetical protein
MTAADTALRVLIWAMSDAVTGPGRRRPVPTGDLAGLNSIEAPGALGEALAKAVGDLAAVTGAQLSLSWPVFGDPSPASSDVVLMAAAIGARDRPSSVELGRAARAATSAEELLARHGLVRAVLGHGVPNGAGAGRPRPPAAGLPAELRLALIERSPLTGVLGRPTHPVRCEDLVEDVLLGDRQGRNLLVRAWSQVPRDDVESDWRGGMLASLARREPAFVLDTYETAMARHQAGHLERVQAAAVRLAAGQLRAAAATARWWQALAQIQRSRPESVRRRPALTNFRTGLQLYWQAWHRGALR